MKEIGEIISYFLSRSDLSDKTKQNYRSILNGFLGSIQASREIRSFTRLEIKRYIADLPVGYSSRRKHLQTLSSLWSWAIAEDLAEHNPTQHIRVPRPPDDIQENEEIRHIPPEVLAMIFHAIHEDADLRLYSFVNVLLDSGARISEARQLNLNHLTPAREARIIGKGRKARTIYWGDRAADAIEEYISTPPDQGGRKLGRWTGGGDEPIWTAQKTGAWAITRASNRIFQDNWDAVCDRLKYHYTLHQIRHSVGVDSLRYMTLEEAQFLLGHSSVATTQRYRRVSEQQAKIAANKRLRDRSRPPELSYFPETDPDKT